MMLGHLPLSFLCVCCARSHVLLQFGLEDKMSPSEMAAHRTHVGWVTVQARPSPSEGRALWEAAEMGSSTPALLLPVWAVTQSLCSVPSKGVPRKLRKLLGKHTYPSSPK